MTENTHYKAPASELLRALPLSPPLEDACCVYNEPELSNHYMQVMMKPLKPGQAPRTKFLVKELLLSDFGFRRTLEVRTLGCARRFRLLPTCTPPPHKDLSYGKNNTRDTGFILVRATVVV